MVQRAFGLRFRFSLATLMIAMTLAAFGSWWLRSYAFRPRREAVLLQQLSTKHGTGIAVSYQTGAADEPSYGPVWWFTQQTPVVALDVREAVRDMPSQLFSTFTELRQAKVIAEPPQPKRQWNPRNPYTHTTAYRASYERLQTADSMLTPQQWHDLLSHPRLTSLEIAHQELAIGYLERLAKNRSIRHLTIRNARLDNADVAALGRMHQLESLTLVGQQCDGQALAALLPKWKSLHSLRLVHCPVGDAVLPAIARMPALQTLHLSHTIVTNAGIRHLVDSPSLRELHLDDTFVSFKATDDLAAIPSLKMLNLVGSGFDQEQLQTLSARAPHLTIRCLQPPVWPSHVPAVGTIGAAPVTTVAAPPPAATVLLTPPPSPVATNPVDEA